MASTTVALRSGVGGPMPPAGKPGTLPQKRRKDGSTPEALSAGAWGRSFEEVLDHPSYVSIGELAEVTEHRLDNGRLFLASQAVP
jgi:hypothetical protein